MSCINEYRKFIKDHNYNNYEHYNNYILPDMLVMYPTLLRKIQNEETADLPNKFCKELIKKYRKSISTI